MSKSNKHSVTVHPAKGESFEVAAGLEEKAKSSVEVNEEGTVTIDAPEISLTGELSEKPIGIITDVSVEDDNLKFDAELFPDAELFHKESISHEPPVTLEISSVADVPPAYEISESVVTDDAQPLTIEAEEAPPFDFAGIPFGQLVRSVESWAQQAEKLHKHDVAAKLSAFNSSLGQAFNKLMEFDKPVHEFMQELGK